jgi:hypothetical protein
MSVKLSGLELQKVVPFSFVAMSPICLFTLICFLSYLSVARAQFYDFCKQGECFITSSHPTSVPVPVTTTTQHRLVNNTFVYSASFQYDTDKTDVFSDNSISLVMALFLRNDTADVCADDYCWVRMRVDSKYDFPFELGGFYDIVDHALRLYPVLQFIYPSHVEAVQYTVGLDTCIIAPSEKHASNPCLQGLHRVRMYKRRRLEIQSQIY